MSTERLPHLSKSLKLPCGLTLANRIAKSPLAEELADKGTLHPSDVLIELYKKWGEGGAGLLVSGNVHVDRRYRGDLLTTVLEDESGLSRWKEWAHTSQAHGVPVFVQLNHAGRQCPRPVCSQPIAPSEVRLSNDSSWVANSIFRSGFATPREATVEEIEDIVHRFAVAAGICKKAGFAGVQIHAAHGYLLSSFLSPRFNKRTDRYGGSEENRMRALLEVVRAVRKEVGPSFAVSVKLNSADFQKGGFSEEESLRVVAALEKEGVDLLEVSGGNYENPKMFDERAKKNARGSTLKREAYFFEFAEKVRATCDKLPVMLTGGFSSASFMEEAVSSGSVDVVGLGRPFCLMPRLAQDVLSGKATQVARPHVEVSIRAANSLLQIVWYQEQMKLIAQGKEPDENVSRWGTLLWSVFKLA